MAVESLTRGLRPLRLAGDDGHSGCARYRSSQSSGIAGLSVRAIGICESGFWAVEVWRRDLRPVDWG